MKPLTIRDAEIVVLGLQDEIRRSEESRYDHRLHGVLLVAQGMSCRQVSQLLGDAPRTVAYWVRRFEKDGLTGLTEQERPGRPRRLSEEQLHAVDMALRGTPADFGLSGNLWDGKTLSAYVQSQWDVRLGTRQCQRLFRQLGFRLRKPRSLIAHADAGKQARVKKLRRLAKSQGVDLWAMDEVHFEQHGSRCRMWIPPENADPVLLDHPTRRSMGYFGAVRLRDGKLVYRRETDRFNGQTCFAFLRQLWAVSLRSGRKVVVITDNARYHHAALHREWRKAAEPWFRLEFLPPYSPDLNPAERVWKLTRRLATHNRYFPTIDEVIAAVERTFKTWHRGNEVLRRLCAIN